MGSKSGSLFLPRAFVVVVVIIIIISSSSSSSSMFCCCYVGLVCCFFKIKITLPTFILPHQQILTQCSDHPV